MSSDPEPGLAPEHLRPQYDQDAPVLLTVDGQRFRVRARAGEPGTYDFDWLSGPSGYGFGLSQSGRSAMTLPEMEDAIRAFLANVDPATGYLTE